MSHKEKVLNDEIKHWRRCRMFCREGTSQYAAYLKLEQEAEAELAVWLTRKGDYNV